MRALLVIAMHKMGSVNYVWHQHILNFLLHPFLPLGIHDPTIAKDIDVCIVESQIS